jgi:RNA polymerase sigma factor (sigma-70 family)
MITRSVEQGGKQRGQESDQLLVGETRFSSLLSSENLVHKGRGMSLESKHVENFKDLDDQAALYERYGSVIFSYLRLQLRSLEDAEDLLFEVFLAALEHDNLSAFSPGEQLAWLRRVAHNKLANVYRRESRHPHVALDAFVEIILGDEGPEQLALQGEERGQLRAAIKKLPALQQHILQLRYADGLRCSEIAVLLNKREAAVRKLLSRSIFFLRQVYQQMEGEGTC